MTKATYQTHSHFIDVLLFVLLLMIDELFFSIKCFKTKLSFGWISTAYI